MNKKLTLIIMTTCIIGIFGCKKPIGPSAWSRQQVDEWFEKGYWKQGWNIKPSNTIDRKAFAAYYHKNPERWDMAFTFLRENNLADLEAKKYELDSTNLYVSVSDYNTKDPENAKAEAHRKYIDIQYVASGEELIGLSPISAKDSVLEAYDESKDVEHFTVTSEVLHRASPGEFFIFFPSDAHRPGIKTGENAPVHKIVVKIRID
jgi:YhcH/YjgK/YiaL family protein